MPLSANPFSLRQQLAFYGAYHTNKVNVGIHIVCVPIIWTLSYEPLRNAALELTSFLTKSGYAPLIPHFNLASLAALLYWVYYAILDVPAAVLISPFWVIYYILAWHLIQDLDNGAAVALGLHVFSWIAQFYGHGVHEGRAPALLDNLLGAVVLAPLFVFLEVLFHFGYAPELQRTLKNDTGRLITEFRSQQAAAKRSKAQAALGRLTADVKLTEDVLSHYIKPQFSARAARSRVSASGRAKAHSEEHPVWDMSEDDSLAPGACNVLGWCIDAMKGCALSEWERVWPLLVPPVMVLLDDADLHAKIKGVQAALALVEAAPSALLQRTGIDALLDDALAHAFYHLGEAPYGPPLLRVAGVARIGLASLNDTHKRFDMHSTVYADGVLAALSYCGPAAAAAPALIPDDVRAGTARMPTITSPRLQQVLAGSAVVLAIQLAQTMELGVLRFWSATMEWCNTWIDNAFSACTDAFPRAQTTSLTALVDQATGDQGCEDAKATCGGDDDGWPEAGDVLVESVCAAALLANTLFQLALDDQPPTRFPGLDWGKPLLVAISKCWIRLTDIPLGERYVRVRMSLCTLYSTLIRDDSLREVAAQLQGLDARLSGLHVTNSAPAAEARDDAAAEAQVEAASEDPKRTQDEAAATPAAEEEAEVCFICADPIELYSIPPCNHSVCHICSVRLRALWKNNNCAFCKNEATRVIFTRNNTKTYGEFTPDDIPFKDDKLDIYFENKDDLDNTIALLHFNCPHRKCNEVLGSWSELRGHVKHEHSRLVCDLCVKHKKIFAHEHTIYTASSLQSHLNSEHRYCEYCRQYFYSDDELWVHMRDNHEQCHICKNRSDDGRWRYYRDYRMLEDHFRSEHYLCMDPGCLEKKFVVFENNMEFQVHQVEEHGKSLSSRERRDALRVDTSYMYEEERRKKNERQENRREGGASSSGQSLNARRAAFGHALTSDRAESMEQYWSTVLSMLNDSQTKLTAVRGAVHAFRASETPVGSLVQTIIAVTSDSNGQFDHGAGDIIVQSLAEMLEGEKKGELQEAWSAVKVQPRAAAPPPSNSVKSVAGNSRVWNSVARAASSQMINSHEHFPTLGSRPQPAGNARIPGSLAHSKASQGRISAANGASVWSPTAAAAAPTSSPSAFPPLGASASSSRQAAASTSSRTVTPRSVAVPQTRGGARVTVSESAFPSLPSNAATAQLRAKKRELLGNTSRSPLVPSTPASCWGTGPANASSSSSSLNDFPALGGVRAALPEEIPTQQTGKQRRKRVLMSNAGGPRI
ncbi:RING-type E3 ubiquitin transferase [Malassezia cuniculi]|uniref:RING-type E3 ubiquitin transferase n=1 Tax=Malassezia cuniculi TaxID=948313 RepID=A0AAF0J4D2_9BASI|nr:RING-type E3 ubiquitin transferase [Malassezia cuniculi]